MQPIPLRDAYLALIALSLGFFMNLLDQSIVSVAMADIMSSFNTGYNQAIWVSSAYFLALVIPILVTGRLGDQLGQRRMFVWGISVFTATSLWCGLATSIESLIIARFFQGIGAAMASPQMLAVITRVFHPKNRGPAMGLWGTVAGLATLTGPLLGGFLVSNFGWEWIFFINVPVGILCVVLALRWIPMMETSSQSFDYPGIVTSIFGMTALVVGIQQGEAIGWNWWVVCLIIAGVNALGAFVYLQSTAAARGVEALVPLELFANRNFSLGTFSISMMGFAVASNALPILLYLQQAERLSAFHAGLTFAPMALVAAFLAPVIGGFIGKVAPRLLSIIGFTTMIAGHVAMFGALRPGVSLVWVVVASVILGVGNSFVWAPNSTTTLHDVEHSMAGAASGVYNTSRQVGAVLGSAATAAFIQVRENAGAGYEMFGHVLLVQAIALFVGLIAVSRFRDTDARAARVR